MAQARLREPKTPEESDAMARTMRENKRQQRQVQALHTPIINDIEKLLEKARGRMRRSLKHLRVRYERMEELQRRFARKRRSELIPGRRKTFDFPSGAGKLRFRDQEDELVLHDDEEIVAQRLLDMDEKEFAYLKPVLNREAIELLANRPRVLALAERAGFHLEKKPEKIYVDIHDTDD